MRREEKSEGRALRRNKTRRSQDYQSSNCMKCLNSRRSRVCIFYGNIAIAIVLVIFSINWYVKADEAIDIMAGSDCAISMYYNSIMNGFSEGNSRYFGILGYVNLFQTFKDEVKNVKKYDIPDNKLNIEYDNLLKKIDIVYQEFSNQTVVSPVYKTLSTQPLSIKFLKNNRSFTEDFLKSQNKVTDALKKSQNTKLQQLISKTKTLKV